MATKKQSNDRHKDVAFTTRLPQEFADQLKALAADQRRSYGNMLALLAMEALKAKQA